MNVPAPYLSQNMSFSGLKDTLTINAGQSATVDRYIDPNVFVNGAIVNGGALFKQNAVAGDSIQIQAIDKDGVITKAGTVLFQPFDWYVDPNNPDFISVSYGKLAIPGIYIRLAYTSTGLLSAVTVQINWFIHKVMVAGVGSP